ncbi:hypothetical protein LOZ58_004097 [Ophidiomyces ophidiicola]|nr:hypothetical protein LOZ58_004097 [Ophidiomyces ophidiicola]
MASTASPSLPAQSELRSWQALNEDKYRQTVLFLPDDRTEDDIDNRLLEEAKVLGLSAWEVSPIPQVAEQLDETDDASSTPSQYAVPPTATTSPSRVLALSSMTWPLKARLPSSRHSITSLSTCPTTYSCSEPEHRRSITDYRPSRHSLNLEGLDRGFKIGLKHAIARIPNLRRRKADTQPSPPRPNPSTKASADGIHIIGDHQKPRKVDSTTCFSTSKVCLAPGDDESLKRTLASQELSDMRATHEIQMKRYLVFRKELLDFIGQNHRLLSQEQAQKHEQSEEVLVAQNHEKAARLEERDLVTELALIDEFKREKHVLQSRIRHMEAYFTTPRPEEDCDTDTLQYLREYGKEYRDRLKQRQHELATIDSLHESKIKVLRDKQAKQYEEILKKSEHALDLLRAVNASELSKLESCYLEEKDAAITWLETKRTRLKSRWLLEESIIRKRLELNTQESYAALPELVFAEIQEDNLILEKQHGNDKIIANSVKFDADIKET